MSILYLVVDKNQDSTLNDKTKKSLTKIFQKGDSIIFKTSDEFENFYLFKPEKNFDLVCLIPNNSEINENYVQIINDYYTQREEKVIYLPLVVLLKEKIKGLLNGCIWNNNLAEEIGVLNPELALRQIDTTLFGALIPFDVFFDKNNYKNDLKYYQHFYFLNKITASEDKLVFGVPKVLLFTDIDLSFSEITTEEKIKYFKQAKEIAV